MKNCLPFLPLFAFVALLPRISGAAEKITVTVANELNMTRPNQTVAVPWSEIASRLPGATMDHLQVRNPSGAIIPMQVTNFHPEMKGGHADDLIFQRDFAAADRLVEFTIEKTEKPVPPFSSKVFARYVPERFDDFAWENDRIAHRTYGPALESPNAGKEQLRASGLDIWCKRVRYLIVDRWYLRGHENYHKDNGEGLDMYGVHTTRGDGGTGVWDGKQLHVSHNWKTWRVLANGPIRAVFELTYEPWDAGEGVKVSETKRFTVDAGSNLDRIDSTFTVEGNKKEITAAVGLAKHDKIPAAFASDREAGWMSLWEDYPKDGSVGVGVVMNTGELDSFTEDAENHLALAKAVSGHPLRYYAGACWSQGGDFATKEDWNAYLAAFAKRIASPLKILDIEAK